MKRISMILAALLCGMPMMAKVQPGSPISDNMVLQQNTKARLFGKAKAGAKVTATPSWNNKTYDISRFLLFFTSNVGAEIFQGNTHLSMARKTEAACQRLVMMFNSPEFVARFGKFGYGIFAFNSLKPEHLRLSLCEFLEKAGTVVEFRFQDDAEFAQV